MKMRLSVLLLSLSAVATQLSVAGEPAPDTSTAGYHLKNRSHFVVSDDTRAPFWPIGWTPSAKNSSVHSEVASSGFELKPEHFLVTSILVGSQSLAVINGRTYGEGENLRSTRTRNADGTLAKGAAGPAFPAGVKIRVQRISDGEVTLTSGVQSIKVPLRRPLLSEPKEPQEDILALDER